MAPPYDLRRLELLQRVAEHGSLSAAAFALHFTPSAVSQQMSQLELEVGLPLLERHSRGVRLTEAGVVLLRHAERALAHLEAARAELATLGERLAMGAFTSAWGELVPRAAARFRAEHPGVALALHELEPREGIAAVRGGEIQLAVIFEPSAADPAQLAAVELEPLASDELVAVLPAGHPRAATGRPEGAAPPGGSPGQVGLADLAGEAWVLPTGACGVQVRQACAAAGFSPRVAWESGDYAAVLGFVAAGGAVALVPRLALGPPRADVAVRRLAGEAPARRISAARAGTPSAAADAMVGVLRDVLAA
jgi:DNA-binding transcriptional LysR family regulator